jgi:type II restriction enzyme
VTDRERAKIALDKIIRKARVHLYKPIQIAEILYKHRSEPNTLDLLNLSDYRNQSKKWRDEISLELLGRVCTSSARFQDDLFNDNAIPPEILDILGKENVRTGGAVEAYIYNRFTSKHVQLAEALEYCGVASKNDFALVTFINSFRTEAGLKRSIDKIYEVVVYALFATLVSALDAKIEVSINPDKQIILSEFEDFARMVMCIETDVKSTVHCANVFRVGVTNAADRGLDMYTNWGATIQVKHLSLSEELAEEIVDGISSDRVVIVCKDVEEKLILSLLNQIGWRNKIQSIVTENQLIQWYEKALRGKYADILGDELLLCLREELANEFPSQKSVPDVLRERGYKDISDDFWQNTAI